MNKSNQQKTPLFTALVDYAKSDVIPFDVPGHKRGHVSNKFNEALAQYSMRLDVNSSKKLDMLGNPHGVILESEKLIAEAYSADHAFMLVNGSTSGVQYMIMSACSHGSKIIMPRNVHKSAINGLILSGALPVFIQPEVNEEWGIANGVSLQNIKTAIIENPDAKAIFLINPTYFGAVSDLKSITVLAHKHNMAVLVDEAHGSHFPFHPSFPHGAMALGADMSTISMHKTGGSLTQSSVLLLNEGILTRNQVRTTINLFQTTSASYLLMASIDVARQQLVTEGKSFFSNLLQSVGNIKDRIKKMPGLDVLSYENIDGLGVYGIDELKIVVRVNDLGLSGFEVYDMLCDEYHIQVELAETNVILAIVSVGDDDNSLESLVNAFQDISRRYYGKRAKLSVKIVDVLEKPELLISPKDAYYSQKKSISIDDAKGEISGESIMIYPPGIPLVIPGEKISEEIIRYYKFLITQNSITINDEENNNFIKVLGK